MRIFRTGVIFILIVLSSLAVKAQSIVGTWEYVAVSAESDTLSITLTFNEDNTFERTQKIVNLFNQYPTFVNSYEGKYKIFSGGKKILMKIKPSSVKVIAEGKQNSRLAKISQIAQKASAAGTLYTPKIVSLTENELILKENVDDDIAGNDPDVDYSHSENFTYIRKK